MGADCRRLALFEGVFGVPDGISFNSYLLTDEMTVLFDTVDGAVRRTFRENLTHALAGRSWTTSWFTTWSDHAELADLARDYPRAQILCSAMAKTMVGQFFGPELAGRITAVKEGGDPLHRAAHTAFVAAPMVHWPEVDDDLRRDGQAAADGGCAFCFGALNGALFADEVDFDRDYSDEARRYYTNIVGKYGPQVQAVLKSAETLDIEMLLPLHGFVWRQELDYFLGSTTCGAKWEPEVRGVMIAYASVYGQHGERRQRAGLPLGGKGREGEDVRRFGNAGILHRVRRIPVQPPGVRGHHVQHGHFVTMEQLLLDIAAHQLASRRYALIENGSWSPVSGKKMGRAAVAAEGLVGHRSAADSEVRPAARSGGPAGAAG